MYLIPTSKFATATKFKQFELLKPAQQVHLLFLRLDSHPLHTAPSPLKLQHLPEEEALLRLVKFHGEK